MTCTIVIGLFKRPIGPWSRTPGTRHDAVRTATNGLPLKSHLDCRIEAEVGGHQKEMRRSRLPDTIKRCVPLTGSCRMPAGTGANLV